MLKYQVSLKVLNTLNENEKPKYLVEYFEDENPLKARKEAMQLVSDYLEMLKENNRIDETNGTRFLTPQFIKDKLGMEELNSDHDFGEKLQVKLIPSLDLAEKHELMSLGHDEITLGNLNIPASKSEPKSISIIDIGNEEINSSQLEYGLLIEAEIFEEEGWATEYDFVEFTIYGDDYLEGYEYGEFIDALPIPIKVPTKVPEVERAYEVNINEGEGNLIEFKPALVYNFKTGTSGIGPKYHAAKTICAFLNSNGGTLVIGVSNEGEPMGIEADLGLFEENAKDSLKLELDQLISCFFNTATNQYIASEFKIIGDIEIFVIRVKAALKPVFLSRTDGEKEFFIRTQASSKRIIDTEEIIEYVLSKNWNRGEEEV